MKELLTALEKARQEFLPLEMSGRNPHFKSKYSTLADIRHATQKALYENGLAVIQRTVDTPGDVVKIETQIYHIETGQSISSVDTLKPEKSGGHGYGSALTYLRRYAISILLGLIADEDDDGNATMRKTEKPANVLQLKNACWKIAQQINWRKEDLEELFAEKGLDKNKPEDLQKVIVTLNTMVDKKIQEAGQ